MKPASQRPSATDTIVGKFKVVSLYSRIREKEWTSFKRFGRDNSVWEFEQKNIQQLLSGDTAYSGICSIHSGKRTRKNAYIHYPSENRLCIVHFEHSGNSNVIRTWYAIEPIDQNQFWLYILNDRNGNPQNSHLKMKITKI